MTVLVEDVGCVRVLTIDRQDRRNALSPATADALRGGIERAESDGTGAVVLTGAGGHFSAGGDADAILGVAADADDGAPTALMRTFHRLVETVWNSPLPVVAAVSGVAFGGAFNLALACDLVFCSADARFCQVFLRRGVVPDVGGAYLLPRLVGMQRAKELMLLAPEIDAARAYRLGLVNEVLPDAPTTRSRAVEIAALLADGPRSAIAATKRMVNTGTAGSLHDALQLEAVSQAAALRTEAARDGFASFLESR